MKIRSGFVSNSSSSSFICCYATIVDEEKALKYIKEKGEDMSNVLTTEEVIARKNHEWNAFGSDWAGVWCEPKIEEDKNFKYLIFESLGGAGNDDYDFDPDGCGNYNYDVDYEDFTEREKNFIDGVGESNGFNNVQVGYGAGRNG